MRITNSRYGIILSTPGLVIILALVIFPVATLFVTSFLQYTSMPPISFTGFKNYRYILNDRVFWLALRKTGVYTVGVTGLSLIGGMLIMDYRNYLAIVLTTTLVIIFMYLVFYKLLMVPLPMGNLFLGI